MRNPKITCRHLILDIAFKQSEIHASVNTDVPMQREAKKKLHVKCDVHLWDKAVEDKNQDLGKQKTW